MITKTTWLCNSCNKEFEIIKSKVKEAKHHFCSPKCRQEWAVHKDSKRVVEWVKKYGSPQYQGGIGITSDGYVWISIRNKGYHNNQIKLHRYLMQVKLGRPLLSSEIVHHVNGNKLDNDIENLQLTTISEHNKLHGHFRAEKRTDIWTEEEQRLVRTSISAKEFCKLFPKRTKGSLFQQRRRLKQRGLI